MASVDESLNSNHFEQIQAFMLQAQKLSPKHGSLSPERTRPRNTTPSPQKWTKANVGRRKVDVAKSAPDMGAMLHESPSQRMEPLERATTFHGLSVDFDGDTQPMPSQVYRGFKTLSKPSSTPGKDSQQSTIREIQDGSQVADTPAKAGMVDLMDAWKSQTQFTIGDNIPIVDVHSVDESAEDDGSQGLLSSMKRDGYPKTPALAGNKHARNGELLSPTTASKTPGSGLSNFLGQKNAKPLMTATQLFDNTQGISSPIAELARSDPVDSRPSPEFAHLQNISPSIKALSSPSKPVPESSRAVSGPRDVYKPMDESQRRRETLRLQQEQNAPMSSKVTFDDDSQEQDMLKRRADHYRAYSHHLPTASRTGRRGAPMNRSRSEVLPANGTSLGTELDKITRSEADAEVIEIADEASSVDGAESVDEYDEFAQEVIPSQRRSVSQENRNDQDSEMSDDGEMEVAGSPLPERSSQLPPNDAGPEQEKTERGGVNRSEDDGTDAGGGRRLTVANSQPTHPPRPADPSSLSSFVPGSQLVPISSQTRAAIEANNKATEYSSLPGPPRSSQFIHSADPDTNMPSSPPVGLAVQPDAAASSQPPAPTGDDKEAGDLADMEERESRESKKDLGGSKSSSNKTSMFDTAATHITASQRSSRSSSQRHLTVSESPQKLGRFRRLGDIANDPMSQNSVGEVDVSIGMDIVANTDEAFVDAMKSTPKQKKSMVYGRRGKAAKLPAEKETESQKENREVFTDIVETREDILDEHPAKRRKRNSKAPKKSSQPAHVAFEEAPIKSPTKIDHEEHGDQSLEAERNAEPESFAAGPKLKLATTSTVKSRRQSSKTNDKAPPDQGVEQNAGHDGMGNAGLVSDDETAGVASRDVAEDEESKAHVTRVLALFKGSINAFYPATCMSTVGAGSTIKYEVKFDDGTTTVLERHLVCAFDTRIGDIIKIDLPSMRTSMYEVIGFDKPAETSQAIDAYRTDVYGHRFIQVKAKQKGTPKISRRTATTDEPVTVPIGSIYVTQTMWSHFKDRTYTHPHVETSVQRQYTPSVQVSAPGTPHSRSRRQTLNSGHFDNLKPVPPLRTASGGVFANHAFAISSAQKDHLASRIASHGGLVLTSGLHELFDISISHPSSSSSTGTSDAADDLPMKLKKEYSSLGFVALIADTHSRTQKYIQALALSLPTLHHRWVEDCIRAGTLLPWERYLLPAGESSFLFGTVRSRVLAPYDPVRATLAEVVGGRQKLLAGGGVLLYADTAGPGRGKGKGGDRRDVYAFLSLALGAERVGFVDEVGEVRDAVEREGASWKWVHCGAEGMRSVAGVLGSAGRDAERVEVDGVKAGKKSRKRKRSSLAGVQGADAEAEEGTAKLSLLVDGGVRVVSDEFVIQSLILGALVDE